MKLTNKKKWFLGIAFTMIMGGISNGMWEIILKPIFNVTSEFGLNLISFGISKFKDAIYVEIAKNLHESIGLEILEWIVAFYLSVVSVLAIATLLKKRIVGIIHIHSENEGATKEQKKLYLKIFIIFYTIFVMSFLTVSLTRTKYINKSIGNYNQLFIIVRPYIKDTDMSLIKSRFAKVTSENDYKEIIQELVNIAKNNNLDVSHLRIEPIIK